MRELTEKLEETFRGYEIHDIIEFDGQIPLTDLFEIIDEHFAIRKESNQLLKMMETRTIQFRMIQKRLLNRFKDKNPSPLNNLDFLLNHTYEQIIEMALKIEEHQKASKVLAQRLACSLEVVLLLVKIKAKLPQDQYEILRSYLSPCIDSESETGWEEATLASVVHLVRTSLSE
jgi:Bardet-Biedl syndrome 9 protein